jgi:hypothetical protein
VSAAATIASVAATVASLARDGWSLVAGDPWTLGALAVLVVSSIAGIATLAISSRRRRAASPPIGQRGGARRTPRTARVIDLAKHGEAPEAIARRTGLALDAVTTILRTPAGVAAAAPRADRNAARATTPAAAARHASPDMARFAAPGASH